MSLEAMKQKMRVIRLNEQAPELSGAVKILESLKDFIRLISDDQDLYNRVDNAIAIIFDFIIKKTECVCDISQLKKIADELQKYGDDIIQFWFDGRFVEYYAGSKEHLEELSKMIDHIGGIGGSIVSESSSLYDFIQAHENDNNVQTNQTSRRKTV